MPKKILKDSLIEIKTNLKRFLSLIAIILLGVGFFCGIKATSPVMRIALEDYVDSSNFYDIKLVSTIGFTKEDIEKLKDYNIAPSYSFDSIIAVNNIDYVFKILSLTPNFNEVVLIEGTLPKDKNEVVVEENVLKDLNINIGDCLNINLNNENIFLNNVRVKVVGVVESPLYISRVRGSSNLGSGSINYYMYMNETNINSDYYTEVYVNVDNLKDINSYTKEYDDKLDSYIDSLDNLGNAVLNDKYNNTNNEINDAYIKIKNATKKLNKEINNANKEITTNEERLADAKININNLKDAKDNYDSINKILTQNNEKINDLNKELLTATGTRIIGINTEISSLNYANNILNDNLNKIKESIGFDPNLLSTYITNIELEITSGEIAINDAKNLLNNNKNKALKEIKENEDRLAEAKVGLQEIKDAKWYALSRKNNSGYTGYIDDSLRLEKIGAVFPIVFFVVAALVCLTSMTRMVDEERIEIGTLKALGYNKFQIIYKYLFYAFSATLIGGILGIIIGYNTIPIIIAGFYSMMYTLPNVTASYMISYAIVGLLVAFISTVGATIYSCIRALNESPAMLLRPKAPSKGKRVFLESIHWIWKRLKFTQKVTIRNIFRHKKRLWMTLIGIAGCTALIVAGLGLRDSIAAIIPNQYEKTFKYQATIGVKNDSNKVLDILDKYEGINGYLNVYLNSVEITNIDNIQDIILVVIDKYDNIDKYINLEYYNNNDVIITDKLAKLLDIKVGEKISLKDADDNNGDATVGSITTNYLSHYIYMTSDTYEAVFSKEYEPNYIYVLSDFKTNEKLGKELLTLKDNVTSVSFTDNAESIFGDIMDNMQLVAYILIFSAGALAFVVLFNLASVNISERKRELATIKVLGFFDKEVYNYVTKETYILGLMGITFGLGLGYLLTTFIVKTCELDSVVFTTVITPINYLFATLLTCLFIVLVNFITYFILKKIDMIESLKSIE